MIEILNYEPAHGLALYAHFGIYLHKWDVEIQQMKEFRLEDDKGKRRWVSFPSYRLPDILPPVYKPAFRFRNKETQKEFLKKCKESLDVYLLFYPEHRYLPSTPENPSMEEPTC